uniref:Box C/D snoRNA protein 1-like n=1 Tax=Phallusia mammillata TaxID=59560 RepID=A0A6F9DY09_9ASCI|nr:box C/D snoRNA protein 1-like [Phallusia mammillata]
MMCESIANTAVECGEKNFISTNEVCDSPSKASSTPSHIADPQLIGSEIINPIKCWNCGKEPKYKCPNCLIRTCSVSCVKLHKQKFNCDGRRCKTLYKPKENLNENDFLSDYRFLEEVDRCACKLDRNRIRWRDSYGMNLQRSKAASMKINLKLLPQSFSRRKENTTFYCFRAKAFLWRVEWIFTSCKETFVENKLLDKIPLSKAVQKFVNVSKESKCYAPSLNEYVDKKLSFYMKKEDSPANEVRYYKLDSETGLRENLRDKTVVEFPRILVMTPGLSVAFENDNTILR